MGTWENGVFDYDHLKKSYISTYTRYWDSQSKVPFLYNPSTGIWISYDDLQSIEIKTDYIKREELAGAMFWELSGDRNGELIGATYQVLNTDQKPSIESKPPTEINVNPSSSSTSMNSYYSSWESNKDYQVGDHVVYGDRVYTCVLAHKSSPGWTPYLVGVLWQLL